MSPLTLAGRLPRIAVSRAEGRVGVSRVSVKAVGGVAPVVVLVPSRAVNPRVLWPKVEQVAVRWAVRCAIALRPHVLPVPERGVVGPNLRAAGVEEDNVVGRRRVRVQHLE